MSRRPLLAAAAALGLAVAGLGAASSAGAAVPSTTPKPGHVRTHAVCGEPAPHRASCMALLRTDVGGGQALGASTSSALAQARAAAAAPTGLGPADIQSAYALAGASSGGRTVAIVDAYDDPTAEQDLATYRSYYGLSACTTANGCFRKVGQSGGSTLPKVDAGWAQEISLDLDMVSATCPDCSILLVEATSPTTANLGAAVNTAARLGASAISNSYGGSDSSDVSAYNHPGIAITASSGDNGYGVEYPASSRYVTAVGGTSLTRSADARGWSESAWSGAGSGCSRRNPALPAQASFDTGCSRRAVADVSAVADPATGVAVYDSTPSGGASGWMTFGGTSASAPIVASVYALAGHTGGSGYLNATPYANAGALNDVTSGSNGSCSVVQLCRSRAGWDGPTGLGTPNGTGAF